jgi:hypothetical protein
MSDPNIYPGDTKIVAAFLAGVNKAVDLWVAARGGSVALASRLKAGGVVTAAAALASELAFRGNTYTTGEFFSADVVRFGLAGFGMHAPDSEAVALLKSCGLVSAGTRIAGEQMGVLVTAMETTLGQGATVPPATGPGSFAAAIANAIVGLFEALWVAEGGRHSAPVDSPDYAWHGDVGAVVDAAFA